MSARSVCALLAATVALHARTAMAEPNAARGPDLGTSVVFLAGLPEASRAVWLRPFLAVTQEMRAPYDAFGLGVALRTTLFGRPRGWGMDGQLGAGVLAMTLVPGAAITLTPSAMLRRRWEHTYFGMGLAAPLAARLNAPHDLRLPVQGELWFAFRAGPLWLGAMTAIGATLSPGANAALLMQAGGYLAIPYGPGSEQR